MAGARPFAYEEIFYEFGDANERNGNEAGFGATMPVTDHSAIELDLRLCHAKSDGEWEDPDLQVIVSIQRSF